MKNLEQIRAAKALEFWNRGQQARGTDDGDVVSKLPSMIINNGLIATVAFAVEKKGGYESLFNNIAEHLRSKEIGVIDLVFRHGDTPLQSFMNALCKCNTLEYQRATQESLNYLAYLKRFEPNS